MYPVSNEYKSAVQDNTRSFYYEGQIVTKQGTVYPFRNQDIVKGSGYIANQCCGDSEIEIGSVYAAELGITLYSSIDRYSLEGATISLSYFLDIGDGVYEEVPLGIFDISEANRTINCLDIKAYDFMLRFDIPFGNIVSSGTAYSLLSLACETCGVELAHTEEEVNAWRNADELLGIYSENDIETWRDVLFYLAQALGRFCTINRKGQLELREYRGVSVCDIAAKHRYSSSFSDFVTRYTSVSSENHKTQEVEYYAKEPDDGLTLNLGMNPLLQFGLAETRQKLLTNILDAIAKIRYVPFDSSTIGDPALDLGDIITFSGGHADEEQITCITKYEIKVNGKQTLKCVGKNPRLAGAKSKNDKNLTQLMNSVEEGKIVVHTYMNASPHTLDENDKEIVNIEFASSDNTDAQFHASILMEVSADSIQKTGTFTKDEEEYSFLYEEEGKVILTVTYIINESALTTYVPVETLENGKHILNLYYPLTGLSVNAYNTFRVNMKVEGGSITIGRGQGIASISGQGLGSRSEWDGRLNIEELNIGLLKVVSGAKVSQLSGSLLVERDTPKPIGLTDSASMITLRGFHLFGMADEVRINPVILTEIIELADAEELEYSRVYVKTEITYELQTEYGFSSAVGTIDRGQVTKLEMNTEQFERIDSMEVTYKW